MMTLPPVFRNLFLMGCVLALVGLLATTANVFAQDTPPPDPPADEGSESSEVDPVDTDDPETDDPDIDEPQLAPDKAPPYLQPIMERTGATTEQVEQLRADGAGWGNIKIALGMAERIAASSDGAISFEDALAEITALRQDGMGWGAIGKEKGVKVSEATSRGARETGEDEDPEVDPPDPTDVEAEGTGDAPEVAELPSEVERGKGKAERSRAEGMTRDSKPDKPGRQNKLERPDKPERPDKLERPDKPERPTKLERPDKPERPAKPAKFEKPERPQRGNGR